MGGCQPCTAAILLLLMCFVIHIENKQLPKPLIFHLDETRWTVSNNNSSLKINATVPGGIYTDLKNANILKEDFFFKSNDINYRWIGNQSWTYSTTFEVGNDILQKEQIWLVFYGLDTITKIFLNNVLIGKTDNMFVRYRFNVKKNMEVGVNTLEVRFAPPILAALMLGSQSEYTVPPVCPAPEQNGECQVNFLRKMQASFSWDWGPGFPSVGIWKSVVLEAYNKGILRSISVSVLNGTGAWIVSGTVYLDMAPNTTLSGVAQVNVLTSAYKPLFPRSQAIQVQISSNSTGQASFDISKLHVRQDIVKLWWPNGYGDQNLYYLDVTLETSSEQTSFVTQFAFRTVKLVQDPVEITRPEKGLTFYFEINGIKMFAKGSNYIPAHILPELSRNESVLRNLLGAVKDTHMNMLRVWGGGVYESDLFYKLCDQMGIMIWQDMMFACAMYPTGKQFLDSVATEIVQQVRRLQSHPSIVVWAGNNENEAALRGDWYHTGGRFDLYKSDYIKLYVDTVRRLVIENDGTRSFVVSSPSNGLESEREGYVARNPYSSLFGDVHVYNYFADNWDPMNIAPTRFCSEFGIQSLPSYSTLLQASGKNDLVIDSEFMQQRQHHGAGYSQMQYEIDLNLPGFNQSSIEQYIYFSQINQAMSIKTYTEKYRRQRDTVEYDGNGLTMGALYWQLNDVWQAPSWSSIEFGGKWKMLHYFAEKFFAPILVSPWIGMTDIVSVMVISDKHQGPPLQVQLQVLVYRWDNIHPVHTFVVKSKVEPVSSVVALQQPLTSVVGPEGCGWEPRHNCFLVFRLFSYSGVEISPESFLFFDRLTNVQGLKDAKIEVKGIRQLYSDNFGSSYQPSGSQKFELTITTDAVALFVWLDVGRIKGRFSDNGFLFAAKERKVNFTSWEPTTDCELLNALQIQTVKGSYVRSGKQECQDPAVPFKQPAFPGRFTSDSGSSLTVLNEICMCFILFVSLRHLVLSDT